MKKLATSAAAIAICFGVTGCGLFPSYRIMQAKGNGEAELGQATYNRQIRVQEAQALLDAAKLTAQAEIVKAQGVAKANSIMEASLGGPEGYLRWKYIEMLQESKEKQIIYIPTEAGLPVLEAAHRPVLKSGDAK